MPQRVWIGVEELDRWRTWVMAKIEQVDPNEQLWRDLAKADGDGSTAEAHLAAGRAIYTADDDPAR